MITPEQLAKSGTEHGHQAALFCWANDIMRLGHYPQLHYMYAVPNGFFGSPGQKAKMKAEGLKSGVPDICLPCVGWDTSIPGLYIELKVGNNKPTPEQLDWIAFLKQQGYYCYIAYGWEDARDMIINYLKG